VGALQLDDDFSECNDLAASSRSGYAKMVARWWAEAGRFGVLPLDDRGFPSARSSTRVPARRA
jgi:arylsulfatase